MENAFDSILITTAELESPGPRIIYVNRAFTAMTGYAPEEVIGRTPRLLQGPKTDRAVLDRLRDCLSRGEPFHGEAVNYRKDGSEFILEWEITPLRDGQENITHFVSIQRDITHLRQVESDLQAALAEVEFRVGERTAELGEALEAAEGEREKRDRILESVGDGVIVADAHCRIVLVNRAAETLLGLSLETVKDRPIEAAAPDDSLREAFKTGICHSGAGHQHAELQWPASGSEGLRSVQVRSAPVHDRSGGRIGTVAILRDVSREREIDRMKAEFISTAAHELRTPLTSILGYSELLLDPDFERGLSDAQRRDFIGEVYEKAEHLSELINQLLDLSRLETGRPLPLTVSPCAVAELLRKTVENYRLRAPRHCFELQVEDVSLPADAHRLRQVMDNLLDNAVKFSPHGGMIRIAGKMTEAGYEIVVADEGAGMTPPQQAKMFAMFYRADASHSAASGLGLGMSIVKSIVEAHGGDIRVESAPGRGTTVCFTLPAPFRG